MTYEFPRMETVPPEIYRVDRDHTLDRSSDVINPRIEEFCKMSTKYF